MAATVWKGYVSFGLVSVPIRLFVAARESHISFHQIHEVCGTRIKQQLYCPHCERVVERSELVKGYPVDRDTNVIVTSEELKSLEAASSEVMEITQFVKLDDVDPLYYETSYYTVPEEPGRRAYALLLESMKKLNVAAVAKLTLHQREQMVLIRPYHKGIVLHTLYYPEEVRELSEYGKDENVQLQPQEVQLAEMFMKQLTGEFHPENFKDEYSSRVEQLIESKQAGQVAPEQAPKRKLAPVINLMDALKKSIEAREGHGKREAAHEPEEAAAPKKPAKRASGGEGKTAAKRQKAAV